MSYKIKPSCSEGFVQFGLENLQEWRPHSISKQFILKFDYHCDKKVFPYVQPELFFLSLSLFLSQATLSKAWLQLLMPFSWVLEGFWMSSLSLCGFVETFIASRNFCWPQTAKVPSFNICLHITSKLI